MVSGDAFVTNRLIAPSGTGVDCVVDEPAEFPELFELLFVLPFDEDAEDVLVDNTVEGVVAERLWLVDATRVDTVPVELSDVRPDVLCAAVPLPEFVLP